MMPSLTNGDEMVASAVSRMMELKIPVNDQTVLIMLHSLYYEWDKCTDKSQAYDRQMALRTLAAEITTQKILAEGTFI
jgi:hypothetical protein